MAGIAAASEGAAPARASTPAVVHRRVSAAAVLVWGLIATGVLAMAVPLVMTAYISLFRDAVVVFPPSGYSVSWYARILEFPRFGDALGTSLRIAAMATLGSLALGIPASLALVRYRFLGRGLLNVLLLSPLTVPGVVIGLSIYVLVVETEIATEVPLIGSDLVLVLAHLLITVPWVIRLCVANLVGLDRSVEEAAANLGARPWSVLWRVTLPMMRQGIVAAALFAFIVSFENIEMTLFLIAPGQTTLPISVLQYLEYKVDPLVAAVVMVQTLVIAGLLLLLDRYVKLSRIV
ncbi:putative spermidine/putrescine transport system permease protein [Roseomonas rosea]|uniref:Putative spermidine/putrescine transport system permease protein n=1 Tax=Muricoccus roseus TaxID=198092 RepID=A0A1M6H6M6_9PROT|nr:ABC transporter permease [Roseomonas rosea]SHJ17816.1 putative spermidine/putrescine transport system permease protein [Roseomonas rosea]